MDRAKTSVDHHLGGRVVTIHYHAEALTAWAEDVNGRLLPGVMAYEQGWLDFHPTSEVFGSESSGGM